MLDLKGRTIRKTVEGTVGWSLLKTALKHKVDWGMSCTRGTCARCRCLILEGMEQLNPSTAAEEARLEPEELKEGYRLGCQAVVMGSGSIKAINKPYF